MVHLLPVTGESALNIPTVYMLPVTGESALNISTVCIPFSTGATKVFTKANYIQGHDKVH